MPTMGLFRWIDPVEPKKRRVAVGEDAPVGGREPVAVAVDGGRHADDRLVERHAAGRRVAELRCATVRYDGARRSGRPVTAGRVGRHEVPGAVRRRHSSGGRGGAQRDRSHANKHHRCKRGDSPPRAHWAPPRLMFSPLHAARRRSRRHRRDAVRVSASTRHIPTS